MSPSGRGSGSSPEHQVDAPDAFCVVRHAFQLVGDEQHRHDDAQIGGHRLLQRDRVDALLLDLVALGVDRACRRRRPR